MAKEKKQGVSVKKDDDMSEWYTQVITKSELIDYTDVSGCMVFRPYSYAIWEKIVKAVDDRLKRMGVSNCYFPLFIPEKLLKKEEAHVEGFSPEVAWVTHAGDTKLDERLAIRPTSETIMYESYSKWIRSWRDLPLKLNQWNNVVRWEFKHPVPFLRTREFLWNEGHTVFATKKEAEAECDDILNMYDDVLKEYFALYGVKGRKTESEKFAGAEYTQSIELFLPNGRAIQGPDAHHDGQNFAKAFDIKFLDKNEKEQYAWQNTWAITTRMIGVMIMVHGDDKGLVLPPKLAPTQVVIVPIYNDESKEGVLKKAHEIKDKLKGHSVKLDDRDEYRPGWKFNEWEMKGVPIRIEIGPKDIEKNQVVLVRRDNLEKSFVQFSKVGEKVKSELIDMHDSLYRKSKKLLEDNVVEVSDMEELKKAIDDKRMAKALFCGEGACEDHIKEKTGGASSRNIPFDHEKRKGKCVHCGKDAEIEPLFAKSY
ncbi:MAG: proline--tRNA ligase [Candidatus Woesearchaeota archaeon]|jgi:prolyl-tRNA synthetase|nr:proline--tRNA ligase [Candidatus Woesearchaeota archaeon]